jgi:hypothetical protein
MLARILNNPFINKRRARKGAGLSPVISTIIISGTLLTILVVASFVSANILELQIASTEFEQAKSNMETLDAMIQDVALRISSGGYVQFNQRSGGIGITVGTEKIRIVWPDNSFNESSPLSSLAYRGGSKASGAEMVLRGINSTVVDMTSGLGYVRVETGQGLQIKTDYNRVRIVSAGLLAGTDYNLTEVTFLRLSKGSTTGSGTVNVKVQNINMATWSPPAPFDGGYITVQLLSGQTLIDQREWPLDPSHKTLVVFTEIEVRVSIS